MYTKTLTHPPETLFSIPTVSSLDRFVPSCHRSSRVLSISRFSLRRINRITTSCVSPIEQNGCARHSSGGITSVEEETEEFGANESIWRQMKEIALFAGPALGLWICAPLMSLIDTAVIGRSSSLELASLGPGTVVCDYVSYAFMFISVATSNMVATSLAREDKTEAQHQISSLLFVGLTCGVGMLLLTKYLGTRILTAFVGSKNLHIVPAANAYIQIRGLAWPALLIGWVAQSASLAMKDSCGPLKALVVATAVNAFGHISLCCFLGYGITGAAWATMASQVIAAFMMMNSLESKGFDAFSLSIPSTIELMQIFKLAAPVFIALMSKVAFFSLLTYSATSMGTTTLAAHQVMVQIYCLCTVWGEPLSQTAQSFMPRLLCGVHRSLEKALMLLNSLLVIGAITGMMAGAVGTFVPWLCPYIFTSDSEVIGKMHKVLLAYFAALVATPLTNSVEGTLLAGRDVVFLSLSMSGCISLGCLLLLLLSNKGFGLPSCWWAVAGLQWARFLFALRRLTSPTGLLYSEQSSS